MEKRKLFSNVDVLAITRELDEILSNSTIVNVYEIEDLLIRMEKNGNQKQVRDRFHAKMQNGLHLKIYQ